MLEGLLIIGPAYSQCRQQLDGSWAPDPSWQCQQPGSSPSTGSTNTGNTNTDNTNTGNTNSGGGSGTTPSGGGGSQAATIGDCTTASPPSGWEGVASTSVSSSQSSLLSINAEVYHSTMATRVALVIAARIPGNGRVAPASTTAP